MNIKHFFVLFNIALFLLSPLLAQAQSGDYPGRATYPSVSIYETEQLNKLFEEVTVVDVRSGYEFDTLHINNAINIPLNSKGFAKKVAALQSGIKPIVFYCNGHTCYKSYKATTKAMDAGIPHVFSYDSGIFDWAKAHPEKATMLGHTPLNLDRLISKSKLQEHLLDSKQFSAKIDDNTVILDIREPVQRGLSELYPFRQKNISLGQKKELVKLLTSLLKSGNTLLVYDEAGKQVRWLQYYLEAKGISNYFFMAGGAKQFFKDLRS